MIIPFGKAWAATTAFVCVSFSAARDARATLGGDVASITTDQQTLSATHRVDKLAEGERHELVLPSGIVVHEYLSPAGAVYAIAWHGPRMPNLRALLGPYFEQLSRRSPSGGHHRMNVRGADFVAQAMGHRGSFSGRAWVPSLVPAGVQVGASLE